MKLSIAAALLLSSCGICRGVEPTSGVRVEVASAGVTGLDCRRRDFQMEYTKGVGRRFRQMASWTFTRDPDPRDFAIGVAALIIMAPLAMLAVPADLLAAPFRRECGFEFHAQGRIVGWAGAAAGPADLVIDGRSLVSPGLEEVEAPVYVLTRSSAAADAQGRFEISVPGRVGRGRDFEVHWLVDKLPAGTMYLRKRGRSFVLSEPESEFGSGMETIEPIVIRPK